MPNFYESPQRTGENDGGSRWKWRVRLTLSALVVVGALDWIALAGGFSLRQSIDVSSHFESAVGWINVPGIVPVLLFGELLHHPDDELAARRNVYLYFAGGVMAWTCLGFSVGWALDRRRNVAHKELRAKGPPEAPDLANDMPEWLLRLRLANRLFVVLIGLLAAGLVVWIVGFRR